MNVLVKASLLAALTVICGGAVILSHRVHDNAPPPEPQELYAIVNSHLAALRADDFRSAYRFAATGVQQRLSLPQYESIARRDYWAMAEAQRVEFGGVHIDGRDAIVQVLFIGTDRLVRVWKFTLVREDYGWKISGQEELESFRSNERLNGPASKFRRWRSAAPRCSPPPGAVIGPRALRGAA
jgi:hypothetical protein